MDRRAFLRRMAVTLGTIAVAPAAAAQLLGRPREFAIPLKVTKAYAEADGLVGIVDTPSYPTIASLSRAYMRSTTRLYEAYTRPVPEYRWLADAPMSRPRDSFAVWEGRVLG